MIEVDQSMIFNYKDLVDDKLLANNTKNEKVPWSKKRQVYADGSNKLKYKINFDDF